MYSSRADLVRGGGLRSDLADLGKGLGHLKSANSIHVGGNDRNTIVSMLGVAEDEVTMEIHLHTGRKYIVM